MLEKYLEKLKLDRQVILKIRVHAKAKQTRVKSILADETIKIDIKESPTNNQANEALLELLANDFNVNKNNIIILSGNFSADKIIKIKIPS